MLHQLTISSRTSEELRQLARERRQLALDRSGSLRSLLIKEAKLLEFNADLRSWLEARPAKAGLTERRRLAEPSLDIAPFLSKLASRTALSFADQQALLSAASSALEVEKGDHVTAEGGVLSALFLVCSGMLQAVRTLPEGDQQVVAVYLPGEMVNPAELVLERARTSVQALTAAVVLPIPLAALRKLIADRPAIATAIWRETSIQAAIQLEWLVAVGRRSARGRLAHLLCELSHRLQVSADGSGYDFPLTQQELGDVLALSTVHVNRMLQTLRSQGLIELSRSTLHIKDRHALYELADFDPGYLGGTD
ncbi:Crp/Fnr family transcriptional regulator [Bradyrhizobium jicamae]|uniref:Crp/Fnr family transcriptional regulator n=1 Tax=Bradyrhizobium jicamae TaxID=280332 RepID=UPI001BA7D3DB|nr:Crp/Fnr family transcriptional regulator [Bradyrhizobium jicamae]MBR0753842.1 Crp/Fnr family transcriptional regulator [Bradyrhizobium jicamae]